MQKVWRWWLLRRDCGLQNSFIWSYKAILHTSQSKNFLLSLRNLLTTKPIILSIISFDLTVNTRPWRIETRWRHVLQTQRASVNITMRIVPIKVVKESWMQWETEKRENQNLVCRRCGHQAEVSISQSYRGRGVTLGKQSLWIGRSCKCRPKFSFRSLEPNSWLSKLKSGKGCSNYKQQLNPFAIPWPQQLKVQIR